MSQNYFYPPGYSTPAGDATAANQVLEIAELTAINANTAGAATETTAAAILADQATVLTRLSGALVPAAFDEIDLTYISVGNGTGQVGTATYKLASVVVKTLTLTYDPSDRLISVVAS